MFYLVRIRAQISWNPYSLARAIWSCTNDSDLYVCLNCNLQLQITQVLPNEVGDLFTDLKTLKQIPIPFAEDLHTSKGEGTLGALEEW